MATRAQVTAQRRVGGVLRVPRKECGLSGKHDRRTWSPVSPDNGVVGHREQPMSSQRAKPTACLKSGCCAQNLGREEPERQCGDKWGMFVFIL